MSSSQSSKLLLSPEKEVYHHRTGFRTGLCAPGLTHVPPGIKPANAGNFSLAGGRRLAEEWLSFAVPEFCVSISLDYVSNPGKSKK